MNRFFIDQYAFLLPLGSEALTSHGSDASSNIWDNLNGITGAIKQHNLAYRDLKSTERCPLSHNKLKL